MRFSRSTLMIKSRYGHSDTPLRAFSDIIAQRRVDANKRRLFQIVHELDTEVPRVQWGWLPALTLVGAVALLVVSLANTAGRYGQPWAEPLLWSGLVILIAPCMYRLATLTPRRTERIGIVVVLGLVLYLVKLFHSPVAFTFHDEFLHWRTATDIAESKRLFGTNALLPASPLYPGLEIVTVALASMSGMSIFTAGVVMLGIARIMLMLGLYLCYEQLSRSSRVASIAAALYTANPNYVFFGAMFAYESLALPMAALILFALARRAQPRTTDTVGLTLTILLCVGLVITTHHVTSYILLMFLMLWTIISYVAHRIISEYSPTQITLLVLVATLFWLVYVASLVVEYLAPHLVGAIGELLRLFSGEQAAGRQLFRSSTGHVAPIWERVVGLGAVGLTLLGLPYGVYALWQRYRTSAFALTMALGALAYPASQALRFTGRGWEIANRSSEFLFVTVSFVLALAVVYLPLPTWLSRIKPPVFSITACVLVLGGIIAGWPPTWRTPGPYLVAAITRSIEPQGILAAEWVLEQLGPNNYMGADQTNMLLMGSYGRQHLSTTLSDGVDVGELLYAPSIGGHQRWLVRHGNLRYLVVDQRLRGAPHIAREYYPDTPVPQAFAKFENMSGVARVFDSGDIIIYDIGALRREP